MTNSIKKLLKDKISEIKARYPKEINIEGLEPALTADITEIVSAVLEKQAKAFGGCLSCYGKGYFTVLQFAQSYEDFGGEKTKRVKLPTMRFCDCERGKQLKELVSPVENH